MLRKISVLLILGAVFLVASNLGCGGNSPTTPVNPADLSAEALANAGSSAEASANAGSSAEASANAGSSAEASAKAGHVLWGWYDVTIDTATLEVEIVPLRTVQFTANVTGFMQPPSSPTHLLGIQLDTVESDIPSGYIVCDVTLKHPFPGMYKFRGFDVRGVCMGDGSVSLNHDSTAVYGGQDDLVVLNTDGYTRWWNAEEFGPEGKIFGYIKGGLAPIAYTPTAILNGYKYFADELGAEDPVILDPAKRGTFSTVPGNNTRRYEIQFPMVAGHPEINFGYAVDASWDPPDPSGDPDYPIDSFPIMANCAEPYLITVTDSGSTAWYVHDGDNGGYLMLDIEIFDWQAPYNPLGVAGEISGLWFEGETVSAPVDLLSIATIVPGTETSSVFQVEINGLNLTKNGPHDAWIIAESADPDTYEPQTGGDTSMWTYPEETLSAYLRTWVLVGDVQPEFAPEVTSIDPDSGQEGDVVSATVYGLHFADGCEIELRESGGTFVVEGANEVWVDETEVGCDLDLTDAPLGLYDVVVINPSTLEGSLDEGFEVTQADIIYVDDSNTTGTEDGTMANPYNTIQEGLTAASAGYEVWVDDSDGQYQGQVVLVAGVDLLSVNWDDTDGDDEATIYIGSATSCVLGADNATIEGFEIDAVRCGIECNGTSPEIIDCRIVDIYDNLARAIWLRNNSHAHLDGVEVYDVTNSNYYGYATFFGILIENCDAVGDDKVVIEQTTVHNVYSHGLNGGGYCYPHGIYISSSDGVVVKNSIVHDVTGGNYHYTYGVRVSGSTDVELVNNVIYDIDKQYYYGTVYGLHFTTCTDIDIRNTIVSSVHKGVGGTGGYYQTAYGVYQSGSTYAFEYCDVYDCQNGLYVNVTPGIGCISANPQYVTPGTDFHLAGGSPCINAGDPAIQDPDGSQSDMGAYGGPGGDW